MNHISEILRTRMIPLSRCEICGGTTCAKNAVGDILVCRNRRGPKGTTVTTGAGLDLHIHEMTGDFESFPLPLELPR